VKKGALLTGFLLVVVSAACSSAADSPQAEESVRIEQDNIKLAGISTALSTTQADFGDLVEVSIEVVQEGDLFAHCGVPAVKDTFGNFIAELSPIIHEPGQRATYSYSFIVPANGAYNVELDNRECDERQTTASATVTWNVSKSGLPDIEGTVTTMVETQVAALVTPLPTPTSVATPDDSAAFLDTIATALATLPTQVPTIAVPLPNPTTTPTLTSPGEPTAIFATVTRVVDGDTIDILLDDGSVERVRLLGINTPETFSHNQPLEYGDITDTICLDKWGLLATELVHDLIQGKAITIILDPVAGLRGSFGRLLAYVIVDGQDLGGGLVEAGYARVYEEGASTLEDDYLVLQSQAQSSNTGLWNCGRESTPPISTTTPTPLSPLQP
jgi:endonuclease YncB( thermonuclease family)